MKMESTNTFYPVFEPDQVLTSEHLNSLRRFLATEDRQSRRLLHGIGIVCGMQISNPSANVITISKGVGVTSQGFLVTLADSDCEYYRPYEDKVYTEENCEGQITGKYDLFLKDDGTQYNLWELLTKDEEANIDDNRIKPLSEAPMNMASMYVIVYLEIEDLDMLACFGDDCDEKGIQRTFKARKLIIQKADLLEIIQKAHEYGENITETDLEEDINAKYNLKPVSVKRLGYDFSTDVKTLSLSEYHSPGTLFQNYGSIIKQGTMDVGLALHRTYDAYKMVLQDLYSENPFMNFDATTPDSNALHYQVFAAINEDKLNIQYAHDFLNDLVAAYDEFRKTAFQLVAICCPDCRWFPHHLMLGKALQPEVQPSIFRHHFIPSPIMNQQKELYDLVRLYFRRLVKMVEEMNLGVTEFQEIKVTPSADYSEPVSERSIPFYYNVNDISQLYRLWSFDKTSKHQANTVLSYHANNYNLSDLFVKEPTFWEYKKYDFLRIEGHVGKKYEDVLSNVMGLRERLNLPIKVIGVKLSRRFQNTNVDVECHFDDLDNLFRMFVTELKCILIEEREFFRSLDTDLSVGQTQGVLELLGNETTPDAKSGGQKILTLLGDQPEGKKKSSDVAMDDITRLSSGLRINTNVGEKGEQPGVGASQNILLENSIGYLMDNATVSEGQNIYTAILGIYAAGQFNYLTPGIFIYIILYPVQIAQNIETLLNNIPQSLEELDLNQLNTDYDTLIESANGFKTTIQTNLADPNYQRIGNEEVILYRLDKLIYHCTIRKLVELHKIYQLRIEEVKQLNLFARFAKDHPGMEHMAGVPKGGSFVIVYADKNEKAAEFKPKDIVDVLTRRPGFREAEVGYENIVSTNPTHGIRSTGKSADYLEMSSSKKSMNVSSNVSNLGSAHYLSSENLLAGGYNQLNYLNQLEQLRPGDLWGKVEPKDDLPPDNIVIADFALPYLCCGSCPEIATMVVSQITFKLDKSEFCRYDTTSYKFMTDPKGGRVTGPGVTSQGADYFFTPSAVDQAEEDIQFTYEINSQTVVLNVKVYNPKADFEVGEPIIMNDGNVKYHFFNKSTGADRYLWDFGDDGKTSEEFEPDYYYYPNPEEPIVVVTLKAMKGECENLIAKEIEIPQVQEIIFDIEPKKFCHKDENLYEFTLSPTGGVVTGEGVINVGDKWYFRPAQITTLISEDVEFKYTLPNGQMARITVKVYDPQAAFEFFMNEYDPERKGYLVEFTNKSTGADSFLWDFDDGETSIEENPVHVYRSREDGNRAFYPKLTATRDICEDTFESFIFLPLHNVPTFSIGGKGRVCNNSQELIPFTTDPLATPDNPVTGTNVVVVGGKYYFNPYQVNPGIHTFSYMDKTAQIEVLEAPPAEFGYEIIELGETDALVQFNYSGQNIKSISWNFGDGGKSDKLNPRHGYKDIDFPATFVVTVSAEHENGCTTEFSQNITLDPKGTQTPEINLLIPSLQRLSKDEISIQVFGETNALPNNMINYYTEIKTTVNDPATATNYVNGKNNNKVSKKVDGFSQNIFNKIKGLKKADPDLGTKQTFAYKFFQINMTNILELMSILSNDLKESDLMMISLQKFMEQLAAMKEMGVKINPAGKVRKGLEAKRLEMTGKPVISQGIIDIESMF